MAQFQVLEGHSIISNFYNLFSQDSDLKSLLGSHMLSSDYPAIYDRWVIEDAPMPYMILSWNFGSGGETTKIDGSLIIDIFTEGSSSIKAEAIRDRLREILEANQFAGEGVGMIRTHYLGDGNVQEPEDDVVHWMLEFRVIYWDTALINAIEKREPYIPPRTPTAEEPIEETPPIEEPIEEQPPQEEIPPIEIYYQMPSLIVLENAREKKVGTVAIVGSTNQFYPVAMEDTEIFNFYSYIDSNDLTQAFITGVSIDSYSSSHVVKIHYTSEKSTTNTRQIQNATSQQVVDFLNSMGINAVAR